MSSDLRTCHEGAIPDEEIRAPSPSSEEYREALNRLLKLRSPSPDTSTLGTMHNAEAPATVTATMDSAKRTRWTTRLVRPPTTNDAQSQTSNPGLAPDRAPDLNTSLLRTVADLADKLHEKQASMDEQYRVLKEENETIMYALDAVHEELHETQAALKVVTSKVNITAQKVDSVVQEAAYLDQQALRDSIEAVAKRLRALEEKSKLADQTEEMVQDALNDLTGKQYMAQEEAAAMGQKVAAMEEQGKRLLAEVKSNSNKPTPVGSQSIVHHHITHKPTVNQAAMSEELKVLTSRLEALEYKTNFEEAGKYEGLLVQFNELAGQQRALEAKLKLQGKRIEEMQDSRLTSPPGGSPRESRRGDVPTSDTRQRRVSTRRDGFTPGGAGSLQVVDVRTGMVVEDHPNRF